MSQYWKFTADISHVKKSDMPTEEEMQLIAENWKLATSISREHSLSGLDEFASDFYDLLFEVAPDMKKMFESRVSNQAKMPEMIERIIGLVMVVGEASNAHSLIKQEMLETGQRHAGYGVSIEHLQAFSDLFMATVRQRLGYECFTPAMHQAWTNFLNYIIGLMELGVQTAKK